MPDYYINNNYQLKYKVIDNNFGEKDCRHNFKSYGKSKDKRICTMCKLRQISYRKYF